MPYSAELWKECTGLTLEELGAAWKKANAERLGISPGERVNVSSRRGTADAVAAVTPTIQPGQLFMPMHFEGVNRLTFPALDPHSRQRRMHSDGGDHA